MFFARPAVPVSRRFSPVFLPVGFVAATGLKAQNDYWGNDSIWVQFSGATAAGTPVFREGTASGLAVNLEECNGCGLAGWGWRDEGWGARGIMSSTYLRFPAGGVQSVLIQTARMA